MKLNPDRAGLLLALLVLIAGVGAIAVAYRSSPESIERALALGIVASLVTGLILGLVVTRAQAEQADTLSDLRDILTTFVQGSRRLNGIWIEVLPSADTPKNPDSFWRKERLSAEECHSRLILIGETHSALIAEPTPESQGTLIEAVERVIRKGGPVQVIFPSSAPTRQDIVDFFGKKNFKAVVRRKVELWALRPDHTLHYSAMITDDGVRMFPRFHGLQRNNPLLLTFSRQSERHYCEQFQTDTTNLLRQCDRIEIE